MKRAIAGLAAIALATGLSACGGGRAESTNDPSRSVKASDPSAVAHEKWEKREPNKAEDLAAWERWYVAEPGEDPVELEMQLKAAAADGRPGATDDVMDDDSVMDDEEEDKGPGPQKFGSTFKYSTGLEITISEPELFTPTDDDNEADGDGKPVAFTITITNGSEETYDPVGYIATVASGGEESDSIFDDSLDDEPSTSVQPGKSVKWREGYLVLDPDDITFDVEPSAFELGGLTYVN